MKANFYVGMIVLLTLYVGSYFALSRNGMQRAAAYDGEFYYFVDPLEQRHGAVHGYCCLLYAPLIEVERFLGTSPGPAVCF